MFRLDTYVLKTTHELEKDTMSQVLYETKRVINEILSSSKVPQLNIGVDLKIFPSPTVAVRLEKISSPSPRLRDFQKL